MLVLAVLGALLSYDLAAMLWGLEPLCKGAACSMASAALTVPPGAVYGAALAWVLALLATLPSSSPFPGESRAGLYSVVLSAGVAFEGVLLGFLLKTGTPCTICLVVAGGIGLLLLAELLRMTASGLGGVMVWGAAIMASLLLVGPGAPMQLDPALSESAVVQYTPEGGASQVGREYHVYVQYGCPHCEDLLEGLSRATITGAGTWFYHTVGSHQDGELVRRDAYAEANADLGPRAILKAKRAALGELPKVDADDVERMERKSKRSAAEVVRFGLTGVPGIILREPGMTIVVTGSLPVLQALKNWGVLRL